MKKLTLLLTLISFLQFSCKKETEFIYGVDDVTVTRDGNLKGVEKSMTEFISIAVTDLYAQQISQNQLSQLSLLYLSFGDKRLIEDMLIKNMLNSSGIQLPTNQSMRSDVSVFVKNCYLKLFNREPNELEAFTLAKKITENPTVSSDMVFYAMMTSEEYRFY